MCQMSKVTARKKITERVHRFPASFVSFTY